MALKSTSLSCTVYQEWRYGQTGGSAGGSKLCMDQRSCVVSQKWAWDGDQWVTSGAATNNAPATVFYGPDSDGYSGALDRYAVSGDPLPPSGSGSWLETRTTTISGTAYYSKTLTKADTRTYGWATTGSPTHSAPPSVPYDDGTYAGTLYLYSVVGTPPTPSWTSTEGSTTTTSTSGTAYYDGDVPQKVPGTPGNFRVNSVSTSGVTLAWNAVTNVDYYNIEIYLASPLTLVASDYNIPSSSITKFFTGLFSDTTYQAKLYARNAAGNGSPTTITFTTEAEVVVPPNAPTDFRVTSHNTESVNLAWNAVPEATKYAVETYLQGTSTLISSDYNIAGTTKYVTGLTANTDYTFKLWAINANGNSTPVFTSQKTDTPAPTRPSNWAWTSLVSSIPFSSTYIVSGVRKGNLVNASDWNSFTSRINEFRTYKGLAAYSFSSVGSQQALTNTIYQQAVSAISSMTTVSQPAGYYSKLIALRDALNSIT